MATIKRTHVKYLIFGPILNKSGICQDIFMKIPDSKFHVILCIGRRADTRGRTDGRSDARAARHYFSQRGGGGG
jgi:hypothetical protein